MVNNIEKTNVESNLGKAHSFTIAQNMNILDILSNKMYENPIEAIIREVYSNAIDANIENKSTGKIEVVLPTKENPIFKVTDHGIGMTDAKIQKVYCEYGNSTKDGDNSQIGGFGIGCKTPFAYTDQFNVSSCKNGIRNSYIAYKGDNGYEMVSVSSVKDKDHGTTVEVPVKEDDFNAFIRAANKVFFFAKEFPTFDEASQEAFTDMLFYTGVSYGRNLEEYMANREKAKTSSFMLGSIGNGLIAEIGGVAYGIDGDYVKNNFFSGTILMHIPVGELSVQASREKLNYNKSTVEKLKKYYKETLEKFEKDISDVLNDNSLTYYERHKIAKRITVSYYEDDLARVA